MPENLATSICLGYVHRYSLWINSMSFITFVESSYFWAVKICTI